MLCHIYAKIFSISLFRKIFVFLVAKKLLWKEKVCCGRFTVHIFDNYFLILKTVSVSEIFCVCNPQQYFKQWNHMTRLYYGTHQSWTLQRTFQENWENSLLYMVFCLTLPFWRRDGELAVLKTMAGSISVQGKVIPHLCACYLRLTFTFLVNHVLVNEYLWKGLWCCTTKLIWTSA